MKRTFRALTTTVSVTIDDDLPARDLAAALIAGYPDAGEPTVLDYHLYTGGVSCAGRFDDRVADPIDAIPIFELDLYQEVAWRASPGWLLHAAALETDGRAIVLAGPSGAGKTTLTLALLARGWRLITEEMVLVDRELRVHGLARPIHAPRGAISTGWRAVDYPIRSATGLVHNVITHPPVRTTDARPLGALVRIGHGPNETPRLEPIAPHLALPQLWEATLRRDRDGLEAAGTIISAVPPLRLATSSPTDALALVASLAK